MYQAAEDDAERERNRIQLYAPPRPAVRRHAAAGPPASRPGMSMARAQALEAQLAAEDARYGQARPIV